MLKLRATKEEKEAQINTLDMLKKRNESIITSQLRELQTVALQNGNLFEKLMEATKYCSLGQITAALYDVGGEYRRNM